MILGANFLTPKGKKVNHQSMMRKLTQALDPLRKEGISLERMTITTVTTKRIDVGPTKVCRPSYNTSTYSRIRGRWVKTN